MIYVENRLKDAELLFIENCKNMRHYPLTAFGVRMIFFFFPSIGCKTISGPPETIWKTKFPYVTKSLG